MPDPFYESSVSSNAPGAAGEGSSVALEVAPREAIGSASHLQPMLEARSIEPPQEEQGKKLWSRASQGASSVLQQGLFAGANFTINVMLARWLSPASYGAFALAYAVFLLLLLIYSALFFEPVMVYGAGRYAEGFSSYLRSLIKIHFLLLIPVSVGLAALVPTLARYESPQAAPPLFAAILLSPLLLLVWLCRGAYYAQLRPHEGTLAGVCYFVLLVSSVAALHSSGVLSPASAVAGMAAGSGLVGALFLYRLCRQEAAHRSSSAGVAQAAADHWRYGRWATPAGLANWVPANLFYLLLPRHFGLFSVAALRALLNLMTPLLQSVAALVVLLIPILVRQRQELGLQSMKRNVYRSIGFLLPAGILYLALLASSGARILSWLYAGRYSDVSHWTLLFVGILPVTGGAIGLLGAALRALELPSLVFWGYLGSTIVALAIGVPLTLHYGVAGAAGALVLNDLPAIAIMAIFLGRQHEPMGATA